MNESRSIVSVEDLELLGVLMDLQARGLVEAEVHDDGEPRFRPTPRGLEVLREEEARRGAD